MECRDRKQKRWWMHGILAAVLAVGMLFITPNEQGEAGTLQYHAGINSSERQSDMIFMCELDQIVLDPELLKHMEPSGEAAGKGSKTAEADGRTLPVRRKHHIR